MNETSGVSSNSVGCVISYPPPCGSLNPRDLHCLSSNQDEQNLLQNGQLVQGENQVPESNKDIKSWSWDMMSLLIYPGHSSWHACKTMRGEDDENVAQFYLEEDNPT